MSQSYKYILPILDNGYEEIALEQAVVNNGNVILNGEYASALTGTVSFDYSVRIGISSADDLTGVNFTVIGTQNGVVIQEVIRNVNANTVTSTLYFDSITFIKVTGVAVLNANVSVGTMGTSGYLPAILINTEKKLSDLGYALQLIGADASEAIVYISLIDIANSGKTYEELVDSSELLPIDTFAGGVVTFPDIIQMKNVCKSIVVKITNNQDSKVTMLFLQL